MCNCFSKFFRAIGQWFREIFGDNIKQVLKPLDAIYTQDLSEPLKSGSCIALKGIIRPQCKRFAINLLCVRGARTDIAFHLNPRLALRYIVRNSCINNSWGAEETTSVEKFQLERNKSFEIDIVATEHEFLVGLDGRHICAYVFRVPLERINQIQVVGPIDVENVNFKQVDSFPSNTESPSFKVPTGNTWEGDELTDQKMVVPITAQLPQGFKIGWQLEITGRVKILPSAFYINLQEGDKLWPHPLIPLHLNPRFYTSYGNHLFVRNSWMSGEWGREERTAGFQFTPGKWFCLAIRMNPDSFGVWVDGTLTGEFQFRTPVDTINSVYIHGDVQIKSIFLRDHIDDKYFSQCREKISNLL